MNMEVLVRSCGFQKLLNLNCNVFKSALIIKYHKNIKHLVSSFRIEHYAVSFINFKSHKIKHTQPLSQTHFFLMSHLMMRQLQFSFLRQFEIVQHKNNPKNWISCTLFLQTNNCIQ